MSIHRLALLFSAALLSGAQLARADYSANASCGAGIPAGRSGGIGTYWTSSGASSATISWIRDATNLDDTPLSGGPFRSIQYKFDLDSGGNPVGRTFDPLNSVIGTGRFGSTTAHTANGTSGQSRVAPFLYTASWTCTATARPGTPPAGSTAKAYGYTTGSDPWYLTPTDINQFTGGSSTFDLRIPFSMNLGTAFQTGCSVSYDVAYETAAGTTSSFLQEGQGLVAPACFREIDMRVPQPPQRNAIGMGEAPAAPPGL